MKKYCFNGRVIDRKSQSGIAGLRVEAWDKDLIFDDFVCSALTDKNGDFLISFDESHFREIFFDREPDLFFKIFRQDELIAQTRDSILWNLSDSIKSIVIEIDVNPKDADPDAKQLKNTVQGYITGLEGRPLAAAGITIWRQLMRSRSLLADGLTSYEGHYCLSYYRPAEAEGKLRIVVEARSKDLPEPLFSQVVEAQQDQQIDLHKEPIDQSEFTKLVQNINKLTNGLELYELVENDVHQDISYLAGELSQPPEKIMTVALASRLGVAYELPASAFYAFLIKRVPAKIPPSLLEASQKFTLIDELVRNAGSFIFSLTADIQKRTLEIAVNQNLIGPQFEQEIPDIINKLQAYGKTSILSQPYLTGKTTLGQLLDSSKLSKANQIAFANVLNSNTMSMKDLWATYGDGGHGFTSSEVSSVKLTLDIGAVVKNHVPLINILLQRFEKSDFSHLSDLARLDIEDWNELVNLSGVPEGIEDVSDDRQAGTFVQLVYSGITRAFPTAALSRRVIRGEIIPQSERDSLTQFFNNNKELELLKHNLTIYLEQEGEKAFTGIDLKDRSGVISVARQMQRVLFITSDVDDSAQLLGMGIHSASQIATMGRRQFSDRGAQSGLTALKTDQIYNRANQRYAELIAQLSQFNRNINGIMPKAIGDGSRTDLLISQAVSRDQSLSNLFGSQDYCETEFSTSILSPAAYLCDLLSWLRQRAPDPKSAGTTLEISITDKQTSIVVKNGIGFPATPFYVSLGFEVLQVVVVSGSMSKTWEVLRGQLGTTAANASNGTAVTQSALLVMLSRRPDISNLRLNSQNTEIPVPYIDLINEILSDAVIPTMKSIPVQNPVWKQTSGGMTAADLRAVPEYFNQDAFVTIYNAHYPHSLPYCEGLDELRTYLQQSGIALWQLRKALIPLNDKSATQQLHVVAERFNMAPRTAELIITPGFNHESIWNIPNPYEALAHVPAFLNSASITYDQLLELLDSGWVQGKSAISIQGVSDSCDTNCQRLSPSPLDKNFLDRAHRFLRLWRETGYKMWELDLLLNWIGTLDTEGFCKLGEFRFLQDVTNLSVDEQLAWFKSMDKEIHRGPHHVFTIPLYSRVYLNPAMVSLHPDADLEAILSGKPIVEGRISMHLDSIVASLGIAVSDANLLFAKLGLLKESDLNPTLSLKNLSLLYRIVQLAGIARVSVTDLISISAIIYPSALNTKAAILSLFESLSNATNSLRQIQSIRESGFSIDELTYLLQYPTKTPYGWTSLTAMPETAIAATLEVVRQAILVPGGSDITGNVIAAIATQLNLANDVAALMLEPQPFVSGATYTPGEVVVPVIPNGSMYRVIGLSGAQQSGQEPEWPTNLTPVCSGSVFFQWVDNQAGPILRLPWVSKTLLEILTDPALISQENGQFTEITRMNYPDQFLAIQLLEKVGIIVNALNLVKSDLLWLIVNAQVYGGLAIAKLPVSGSQNALLFTHLEMTVLLVKLSRLFTSAPASSSVKTLFDIITGVKILTLANEADTRKAISIITGWKEDDISSLCSALDIKFPDDYLSPVLYDTLRILMAMIAAMSGQASGTQLVEWGSVPKDEVTAESMAASALKVLKSCYTNPEWLVAAPAIMNPLREHRSGALQDYLIGNGDRLGNRFPDVNALFDYFLIDTQMSSCEVTTRVVQAYVAVQIFVERCRMNLETEETRSWSSKNHPLRPIQVDPSDDIWDWWDWMKRYRLWEAARKVFLYPENWLIESQRINRTELFRKLEQDVHQGEYKTDNFETVTHNYLDGLEGISNLRVVGTCQDPLTPEVHVVGRSEDNPPRYYHRKQSGNTWEGWTKIPLNIKSPQAVPYMFCNRLCLFWFDIHINNEPHPAFTDEEDALYKDRIKKYVSVTLYYSIFRNGTWAPAQASKGKLFDIPFLASDPDKDIQSTEYLYTLKVNPSLPSDGYGTALFVDLFRWPKYGFQIFYPDNGPWISENIGAFSYSTHIGRGVFDGRFRVLELRNIAVPYCGRAQTDYSLFFLLSHARKLYGMDARNLQLLKLAQVSLLVEGNFFPQAGALVTEPVEPGDKSQKSLILTKYPKNEYTDGKAYIMLDTVDLPFSVILPADTLNFNPDYYFFFQDDKRCYYARAQWGETTQKFLFTNFYQPYLNLLWHQLGTCGFKGIYDYNLQQNPDKVTPENSDQFSFEDTYHPRHNLVYIKDDNEIIDFSAEAPCSVYNWELFFHIPLYISELLCQNQQFEDAMKWFHYIFNPSRHGSGQQRFWVTKPLHNLTSVMEESINNLLKMVNQGDPAIAKQVELWRDDPFNPFLIADMRPAAYMKSVVMKYLDNLIAFADNLFATDSREALSEATLLYVIASEVLGPKPSAVTPPKHADDSYNDLAPKLDSFANAMVDIENTMGATEGDVPGNGNENGIPPLQTFYFKIPSNDILLGYWDTVSDRLFKLRHCQDIQGSLRELALFDAPIDPALLIRARSAGIDLSSVLQDIFAPLPNYRYTALYAQALDFVNALRAYGASVIGAIEKSDSAALTIIQQTSAQQLLWDGEQVLNWQLAQAEKDIEALSKAIDLAAAKYDYNKNQKFKNAAEEAGSVLKLLESYLKLLAAATTEVGKVAAVQPLTTEGGTPMGPVSIFTHGKETAKQAKYAGLGLRECGDIAGIGAFVANAIGGWQRRYDNWQQAAKEAKISKEQATIQKSKAELAKQIALANIAKNQKQIDNFQQQLDFINEKFTSKELYDWMAGKLTEIYFQSYKLAYRMCKQVEKCYQYELGITDSNFIQFGYWDSLHKGLLSGETLNHDLRRMHSSYLEKNTRRFELSRYVSLAALDWEKLRDLLVTGTCNFSLPESLFDNDYPGHYNRHLVRMSVTIVYSSPGKFDNVKATLTMNSNKVRFSDKLNDETPYPYQETIEDKRFKIGYAAVPQKIVLGNAQDDPGLFQSALGSNMADPRYLPFEGAGVISSWTLEMPQENNEIDLSTVSDVVLHLYYTALESNKTDFRTKVIEYNSTIQQPEFKVLSARFDFNADPPTVDDPYPLSPWEKLIKKTGPDEDDQTLELKITASKFPAWTRGKTVKINKITILTVSWPLVEFVIQPQVLPFQASADIPLPQFQGAQVPFICCGDIPADILPAELKELLTAKWIFKLKTKPAINFKSLKKSDLGDLLFIVQFTAE